MTDKLPLWVINWIEGHADFGQDGKTFVVPEKELRAFLAQYVLCELEPFGYFKAEPFGWTDCAENDEGAMALYTPAKGVE
jgi:hypothetical protein